MRHLSNEDLLARTKKAVEAERRITLEVLRHLREVDRRRAYAKLGYASLWEYALQELKYSEGEAYRRISAMRALKEIPELETKIETGAISVTAVTQVQSFLRSEQSRANRSYTVPEKAALFQRCENKSSREVTRELITVSPLAMTVQKERPLSELHTEIRFVADAELLKRIHRVRDLSASKIRNPESYPVLIGYMSDVTLDEIDPLRKIERKTNPRPSDDESRKPDRNVPHFAPQPTESIKQSHRPISTSMRIRIWKECGGRCTFVEPESGRRCTSTFGLEIEHCKPAGIGGSSEPENLRLLCRAHNQWQAIQTYGWRKMERYLE